MDNAVVINFGQKKTCMKSNPLKKNLCQYITFYWNSKHKPFSKIAIVHLQTFSNYIWPLWITSIFIFFTKNSPNIFNGQFQSPIKISIDHNSTIKYIILQITHNQWPCTMPRKRQSSYKRNLAEEAKLGRYFGLTEPFPAGNNLAIAAIPKSKFQPRITDDSTRHKFKQ